MSVSLFLLASLRPRFSAVSAVSAVYVLAIFSTAAALAGFAGLPGIAASPPANTKPVSLTAGQKRLSDAMDDAILGNSSKVETIFKGDGFEEMGDDDKSKILSTGLQRAYKTAKTVYRTHKPADSLNRLKLTFSLICFVELGKVPDPEQDSDYLETWISALHKAHLSKKDYIAPLNDYGFFLQETGNDKAAVTVFQQVVASDTTREVAYLNLADSLWKLGRQGEATPLYAKYKTLMQTENLEKKIPPRVEQSLQAKLVSPHSASGSDKTDDFGPFMLEMQRRIKKNWYPPRSSTSLKLVTLFKVDRDGTISNVKVTEPGNEADNSAVLKAINETRLPPLPPNEGSSVDVQFTFSYNVLREHGEALVARWKGRVRDADTADNHIGLAEAYEQAKDFQMAEQEYTKATQMSPANLYYKQLLQKCLDKQMNKIDQAQQ